MKKVFTQGTIIECIRSKKYPEIKCKGVVISAKCDLFNDKLDFFHCLTAMSLEDWIYEVLYYTVVEEKKKSMLGNIREFCKKKELDCDTLLGFSRDKIEEIIRNVTSGKELNTKVKMFDDWHSYKNFESKHIERTVKLKFLKKERKLLKSRLKDLYNSALLKYAFIPQKAVLKKGSSVKGIVIDLQDICQIEMVHMKAIVNYEYDYKVLTDPQKRDCINRVFYFDNEEDFVIADNSIESPWIEYALQLFANSFARIGVENALEYEIEEYVNNFLKEAA